jgi:cytochrome c biogenesis protein CcmG/thiol:disulfide interchange protein DsbE
VPDRSAWSLLAIGALLGLAAGLVAWGGFPEPTAAATAPAATMLTPVAAPVVGGIAPDFEAVGTDGDEFRLRQTRGTVVLLNFWATWCEPCRAEMPLLEARSRALGPAGLLVVGVNFDEPVDLVRAFQDELGLTFPIVLDPGGRVQAMYKVLGYPTTFFIDRSGVIQIAHIGSMDEAQLDEYLRVMGLG